MGFIYLAALIFGCGTILIQLLGSGEKLDAEAGGGKLDLEAGGGAEADLKGDFALDTDKSFDFLPIFLSLRFWVFTSFAFGMAGSLLHYLDLASAQLTLIIALSLGLGSGVFAGWVFHALKRAQIHSGGHANETIGQVGRVLIACNRGGRGKIRLELRGQSQDFLVTTQEERIQPGDWVLVEDIDENLLHVSLAPPEYFPPQT